jgi:hypothetical protein
VLLWAGIASKLSRRRGNEENPRHRPRQVDLVDQVKNNYEIVNFCLFVFFFFSNLDGTHSLAYVRIQWPTNPYLKPEVESCIPQL